MDALNFIILLVGGLGGLSGLAALISAVRMSRKIDVEALTQTIESLHAENERINAANERLRVRLDEFEAEREQDRLVIKELRKDLEAARATIRAQARQIQQLKQAKAGR